MDSNWTTIAIVAGVVLLTAILVYLYLDQKRREKRDAADTPDPQMKTLRLQAYERLTLLVDRMALPNLISRVNQAGVSCREMQMILIKALREEFDYNISQQIYVSTEAWNAVKNLKEQNILVINQLASALPPHATGLDLNKLLLEYLMTDKKGQLHEVVSDVLSYEAKKLL